jgi:hypothetical protein
MGKEMGRRDFFGGGTIDHLSWALMAERPLVGGMHHSASRPEKSRWTIRIARTRSFDGGGPLEWTTQLSKIDIEELPTIDILELPKIANEDLSKIAIEELSKIYTSERSKISILQSTRRSTS